uniref:Uncharacterized protein n=1 Tax=Klebsiella pneumoniae TaxID=573 RepID=A0A8B0SRQ0_KLEPN|nr:hypothetical protein [Klebsiella pneumoniae]
MSEKDIQKGELIELPSHNNNTVKKPRCRPGTEKNPKRKITKSAKRRAQIKNLRAGVPTAAVN